MAAKHKALKASKPFVVLKSMLTKSVAVPKLGVDLPVAASFAFVAHVTFQQAPCFLHTPALYYPYITYKFLV